MKYSLIGGIAGGIIGLIIGARDFQFFLNPGGPRTPLTDWMAGIIGFHPGLLSIVILIIVVGIVGFLLGLLIDKLSS